MRKTKIDISAVNLIICPLVALKELYLRCYKLFDKVLLQCDPCWLFISGACELFSCGFEQECQHVQHLARVASFFQVTKNCIKKK